MELSAIIIVVVFAIITLVGIIVIGLYTRLSFKREKILDKFNSINKFLEERSNLILRVIAILEMPPYHEENAYYGTRKIK